MNVNRGDIVLVPVRFSSGQGQKIRPVLVVQSDHNNARLADTIVAIITSNTRRANLEPTQLLIDIAAPDGRQTGLLHASAVTCERLHTILQSDIQRRIGSLPATARQKIDACLKVPLGITAVNQAASPSSAWLAPRSVLVAPALWRPSRIHRGESPCLP